MIGTAQSLAAPRASRCGRGKDTTGRFLTPDPIKDGGNWYAYCDNNPLGSVDPTRLSRGYLMARS